MPLTIGFLGKESQHFQAQISGHNIAVLNSYEEISEDHDLVLLVSYPKLVPKIFLERPKGGVFVNHSTDLPKGRGWAPIQWSVLQALTEITVTLFRAEDGEAADTGRWAYKARYPIEPHDTLETLYAKDRQVSLEMFVRLFEDIENGTLNLNDQEGSPTYNRKRTPEDAELDPARPLSQLWDQIRASDNDEYPAFFRLEGHKVYLQYKVVPDEE